MEFGVPREIRDLETRVGLTPAGVHSLVSAGHTVYVEKGAGLGSGFSDERYRDYGAKLVYSADEAYGRADVVVKVSRPTAREHGRFRDGQTILSLLHLSVASRDLLQALTQSHITAVAFEMVQEDDGAFPVLQPLSEGAGRLAPIIAGRLLTTLNGGRGTLLSGVSGVPSAEVAVIGAGTLGTYAVRSFLGLGAQVAALDSRVWRLRRLDELFDGRVTTMVASEYNLERIAEYADVIVICVHTAARRAPILLTREMVRKMRPGSVIIDFAIDQGGAAETSRPTTLRDQTYVEEGVIHFCVPNVTALVGRTISHALTNAIVPLLLEIAQFGLPAVFAANTSLARGLNVYEGRLAHPDVADALGLEIDEDLPEFLRIGGVL